MKRNYMVVDATNKKVSDYFESKEDAKVARNELQGELAPMGGTVPEKPQKDGDKGKPGGRDRLRLGDTGRPRRLDRPSGGA